MLIFLGLYLTDKYFFQQWERLSRKKVTWTCAENDAFSSTKNLQWASSVFLQYRSPW